MFCLFLRSFAEQARPVFLLAMKPQPERARNSQKFRWCNGKPFRKHRARLASLGHEGFVSQLGEARELPDHIYQKWKFLDRGLDDRALKRPIGGKEAKKKKKGNLGALSLVFALCVIVYFIFVIFRCF